MRVSRDVAGVVGDVRIGQLIQPGFVRMYPVDSQNPDYQRAGALAHEIPDVVERGCRHPFRSKNQV